MRCACRAAIALLLLALPGRLAATEPPLLAERVAAGRLPPTAERLPRIPFIVDLGAAGLQAGRHGGVLHTLVAAARELRLISVYGYARLVCYTPRTLELEPDILQSYEVVEGRIFTFRLRPGHRWSDGHPFTSEDFRYWWENIANHPELSPGGPPGVMLVDGRKPLFEALDELTVRYSWDAPNPRFLPAIAGAAPLSIFRPAHYLKPLHADFAPPKALVERVKASRQRSWVALHSKRDNLGHNDNPDLPVLDPWVVRTEAPAERFTFVRNPYYHRVDSEGRQLPYIDQVIVQVSVGYLIAAKAGAGETDLQARYIRFDDYTFLKQSETRQPHKVRLWREARGSHVALHPNLNANDPVWRSLFRDVRFRRALSLAINRREINQVIHYGLAIEGNNTLLPNSPLYRPDYRAAWASFDLAGANRLLDEIGLTRRDPRGVRLLPDGRPAEIIVETAGESTEDTDILQLVHDGWMSAGIKLHIKPSHREVFRNRVFSGAALMTVWFGIENGLATPSWSPAAFAPTDQHQLQWPKWGQHYQTRGQVGEPPDLPEAKELLELLRAWEGTTDLDRQRAIWHRMLAINAEQVFSIGLVAGVPQPVIVSDRLRNVPIEGIYNWNPGALFGMYKPDTFWLDRDSSHDAATPRN